MVINECPFCGNTEQYYTKVQIRGSANYYYRFDGDEADNSTLHDDLTYSDGLNTHRLYEARNGCYRSGYSDAINKGRL